MGFKMSECFFYIKGGDITNKAAVKKCFSQLDDGSYLLKIQSKKKRSLLQNQYYWGCVVPMVKDGLRDAGYNEVKTNEDAHEIIKHLFLKRKLTSEKNGDEIVIPGSTAKLTTIEFNTLIDEVIQWASEYLGISIPLPNEPLMMFAEYRQDDNLILITGE